MRPILIAIALLFLLCPNLEGSPRPASDRFSGPPSTPGETTAEFHSSETKSWVDKLTLWR